MKKTPITSRSKQPYVIQKVTKMAIDSGPGTKLPTAQNLAKQLGVTLTTLGRSLGKLESKGIIHRRQGSGIYVSENLHNKKIGMLFGRNIFQMGSSMFYLLLLQHCERRAEIEHEQFSFYLTPPHSSGNTVTHLVNEDLADSIRRGKLDGLLVCELEDLELEAWLQSQEIPTVALSASGMFPKVEIDTKHLIEISLEALAQAGCKTVGLLGILARDFKLFETAAKQLNLTIIDDCVLYPDNDKHPPFNTHEALGRNWMQRCLERCSGSTGLPDGLLITDDILARGACLHLKEAQIKPGRDLQIASHANKDSLTLEYWQDALILAEVAPEEIVSKMFQLLKSQMSGKPLRKKATYIKSSLRLPQA